MTAVPQNMQALGRANEHRFARAALRREVQGLSLLAGRERLADLLVQNPECMRTLLVTDALQWTHRCGVSQARRILRGLYGARSRAPVNVSEFRTVGSLTVRERSALAAYLRGEHIQAAA